MAGRLDRLRRDYEGQSVYSEEFQTVVEIVGIHEQTDGEHDAGVVACDVELPDGRRETTDLGPLLGNFVDGARLEIDADVVQARELLDVLERGIDALEDERGRQLDYARAVRGGLWGQHNRTDRSLATGATEGR